MTPAAFPLLACLLTALWAGGGQAAEASPEILEIQQKIEQLGKLEATPDNKQLKEVYQQALAAMQEEAAQTEKAAGLKAQQKAHDALVRELRHSLEALSAPQPEPGFAGKPLQELERMQELGNGEKIALQNQLDETAARLAQIQARLVPAQNELSEAKKSLDQAGKEGKPPSAASAHLAGALMLKRRETLQAKTAQIQALDLELLSIPNQVELAGLQKTVLAQKLKNLEQRLEKLQGHLQQLRKAESASILDESLQMRKTAREDPALQWLAEENVALGSQLAAYADAAQAIEDRRLAVESQGKLVGQRHTLLQQQLTLGGESGGIGELMRQTLVQLKSMGEENTPKTIHDIQKAQIQSLDYERQINEAADRAGFVQAVVGRFPDSQLTAANADMRERLNSLLDLRANLLAKLLERNQQALKNWSLLLNAQNQFNDQMIQFDRLLKENLLWTATNPPMTPAWLARSLAGVEWPEPGVLWAGLKGQFEDYAAALLSLALLYAAARYALKIHWLPRFLAWQEAANASVGHLRTDRFRNSLLMLAGELLLSLPTPLLLLGLGKIAQAPGDAEAWTRLLGEGLRAAALAGVPAGWLRRLARPGGFLEGQLRWPAALAGAMHRALRLNGLLLALGAYLFVAETQTNRLFNYEAGRLSFVAFCLLMVLTLRGAERAWSSTRGGRDAPAWSIDESPGWLGRLFVLGEVVLVAMDLFGFHLGAMVLQARLLKTLAWSLVVALGHQMLQRWLLLEQRRLAYARAMALHEEREEEGGVDVASKRREFAEIQTISLQSRALLRLLAAAAFLLAAGWIWADLIPAFHLLDQVPLWEAGPGGEAVTLKSLLLALAAAGLVVLALRNLPGLLQLLVLPHLNLAPGNEFAATTLLRYLIFAAGTLAVCRLLGLQWNDLQWLVAALSVGLGFGLQEIFANFISGLIILFEKPVRVGDIVTLNNGVTGTIDAINTRSTTLTDWDNKEIIIPNKTLITEQLTNWSLSSLIIRVVLPVGIAYGSDTERAYRLLLQAAEEHPMVLDKPEKAVFFRAFGASSLDFELRFFVASPAARVPVVHDLNMRIHQLFRENGVEIAFPQMDVHIKDEAAASPRPARRGPGPSGSA